MMTWTSRGYKSFILKSSQDIETQLEDLHTNCETIVFLCALGFCDLVLLYKCIEELCIQQQTSIVGSYIHVLGSV